MSTRPHVIGLVSRWTSTESSCSLLPEQAEAEAARLAEIEEAERLERERVAAEQVSASSRQN